METHKRNIDNEDNGGKSRVFIIRQIMNIIFMIGAIVGEACFIGFSRNRH